MIEPSPLLEKRVLVPRGENQAKSFSQLVENFGGIPVEIPLIAFRPIESNQCLQACLKDLDTYDWIIFTSNVTVETFLSFLPNRRSLPKIAVIGKKTAEGLDAKGLAAEFVPSAFVAETFVEEFLPIVRPGLRILIPKGNLARDYIAASLRNAGAIVDEVVIYETFMPDENRMKLASMLVEKQLDILLFTSPSTVDNFMGVVNDFELRGKLTGCLIGCIGPITEQKLLSYGLPVHVSPEEYTVKEMIKSTIAYIEREEL